MNPVYDNSVPFYPTIPNQNPINTFFPNQMQHNGQYSRDTYVPHYQNAGYSAPPPLNVTYPPSYGYNSSRSVFFPPPNPRSVYPNLGINPNVAPMCHNHHHNQVNPGYYPSSNSGMTCGCANHNPINSHHLPPYPRLVHIGNLIYPLPNPHNSTQFNPPSGNHWPVNQNNTYYQPANQVPSNSTNTNWNYHSNLNQTAPSYTQPAQNQSYPPSHSHNCHAANHAANGNNTSWIPYSNQNTFQPIPDENNDNLSEFSFDPLSSPSELNLFDSTPDHSAVCNHNFALPKDPAPSNFAGNSSQCTIEGCLNHTNINQNSQNVISNQENQAANATVTSLDDRICSDVQEDRISLTDSNGADVDLMNQAANSDQVKGGSTTPAGQYSNNITSTLVSAVNATIAENGTETVLEKNDIGLNQVKNPPVLGACIKNIETIENDQTLGDSISQIEKNSTNLSDTIAPKAEEESTLETTVSSATTSSTIVNPSSPQWSPMNASTESTANADHTYHTVTIVTDEECQHLNNNTKNPQSQPQLNQQSFDSSTSESSDEKFSPKCAANEVNLPTQISTNFRGFLIRYLNRLDDGNIAKDPRTSPLNINDDLIKNFLASLNSENRRLIQQDPDNIVTDNVRNENQENDGNMEKDEADENSDTEPEPKYNEENVSNMEETDADQNEDTEMEIEQSQENLGKTARNEEDQNVESEPEQGNVLVESCADRAETPVTDEDSTESQQHLNEYQTADDVDVINTNLDTIEVTVGDNSCMEEEFLEDVPLDLAKERKDPEPETDTKSRYFEVSQFLPKGNTYWHYVDAPSLQDNATVYASFANDTGAHSVDVLVELPLNLTCKKEAKPAESQTANNASTYPELTLLLTPEALQSTLNSAAKTKNGGGRRKKDDPWMEQFLNAKIVTVPTRSEPPVKRVRINPGDALLVLPGGKPKM